MTAAAVASPWIRAMPLVFVGIWSTGFVVARFGMPHAPPMSFLAWRYALSIVAFGAWIALTRPAWPATRRQWIHLAVSGVLMHWYRDKNCVYCKKSFHELHWADHRPALLSTDARLLTWNEVALNQLQTVLDTHSPVCWDCYIAQDFRQAHPDLVVFRPGRNEEARGVSLSRHH